MECKMWEEHGLLCSSGELSDQERQSFELHLKECAYCTEEDRLYRMEKQRLYTPEILGDAPSGACDAEILRVCSDGRRKVTNVSPMPVFLKRAVLSFALFAIGFIGVGYVTLKSTTRGNTTAAVTAEHESTLTANPSTGSSVAANEGTGDSAVDSVSGKGANFSKTRGNLDLNGVYPVDLQNK